MDVTIDTAAPASAPTSSANDTPLMKQYWELKAKAGDALMFFRMGDFYELFGEDAVVASKILEITLTSRDKNKPNPLPMAGVPHHSATGYLQRLLQAGKKVAIAEQMEDPASAKNAKTIVRRDITRIFTPAVHFDGEGSEAAYLAALLRVEGGASKAAPQPRYALALLDPATGDARFTPVGTASELANQITDRPIKHLLTLATSAPNEIQSALPAGTLEETLPLNYLALAQAQETLKSHYGVANLEGFASDTTTQHALGLLVSYVLRTQNQERLAHLRVPMPLRASQALVLGPRAAQHLDLVPTSQNEGTPTLYSLINRTRSSLGARQLKRWLLEPLLLPSQVHRRQDAVRELAEHPARRERLSQELAGLYDLERLAGRLNARLANPRDTLALGRSLALLPGLAGALSSSKTPALQELRDSLAHAATSLQSLSERILRTQREDAPLVSRDGGIFAVGTDPELDRLISLTEDGQKWLLELEARERQATGIPSLKVRYNRVFGYYLEVTQAHLKNVPSHYQRKQTTVGAERFFTEELKKFEDEIVHASSKQKALEQQLFEELLQGALSQTPAIMEAATRLAELDALVSLAALGDEPGWVFPRITDSKALRIEAGRHPMVDAAHRGTFVPNDLELGDQDRRTLLITGPNMGGKSTVMRQTALIVILGQVGAPVPARQAEWGYFSSVHTRIGAHDAIARGQSTFMVEMSELAHIVHHADDRSLIVLDEIGRGTSTYDGISVAWSTLEWIAHRVQARTLFATHYHELTRLEGQLPGVVNAHLAVEKAPHLRFLYQLRPGPAAESFGIDVAKLAGLPTRLIDRAWKVLEELEAAAPAHTQSQLSLFAAPVARTDEASRMTASDQRGMSAPEPVVAPEPAPPPAWLTGLIRLDLNQLTPLQAMNELARLQSEARQSDA